MHGPSGTVEGPGVQPPELEPYLALARGQIKLGRPQAAERTLEEILQQSPDYPMARDLLGLVQGKTGAA